MATVQIYGGGFTLADGQPIAFSSGVPNPYGTITFRLSQDATVLNTNQICPPTVSFALNNLGSIPQSANAQLWPNTALVPSGTFYYMSVYDGTGALVYGPINVVIAGAGPINLATLTPASSGVSYPGAVLLNPSGDQTIDAFSLLPAANNTTQSLGFQGAEWDAALLNVGIYGKLTDGIGFQGTSGEVLTSTGVGVQWGPPGTGPQGPQGPTGSNGAQGPQGFQGPQGSTNTTQISGVTVSGTPTAGQVLTATSSSAANWQTGLIIPPTNGLRFQYGTATGTTTVTFSPAFSGTPNVLLSTGPGTGTTQLGTTSNMQFTTVSSDGSPFTWFAIGPA
jgi:hypothetical protein